MDLIKSILKITLFQFILLFFFGAISIAGSEEEKYRMLRKVMVLSQIKYRGISDPEVLQSMEKVMRHKFVPVNRRKEAYDDNPLPIGFGQTISQPYIVALMSELIKVDENSKVLEIGTGSGYQAAVLSGIVKEVYTVEIIKPLHDHSNQVFKSLGYKNIKALSKDGYYGWEANAPYDAIIVTCASDFIPPPLIKQLKKGGRMCIPVGPPFKIQHLVVVTKGEDGKIFTKIIASVRFVPLTRGIIN